MHTLEILEKIGAGAIVLVCVLLLLRQFIGAGRRARVDASLQRAARNARRAARRTRAQAILLYRWPAARRAARREADAAIRRARGDAFGRSPDADRRKPSAKTRKLH